MQDHPLNRNAEWSRWWLLIPIVLLLIQISAVPCMDSDSVSYLSMAQSMADHGVMLKFGRPHLVYAFGYPFVLSGPLALGGDTFLTSSLLNAALGLVYLLGVYRWCKIIAPAQAVWVSCLSLCNVIVLSVLRLPLSEPLFMALLLWSTLFLNRVVRQLPARLDWVSIIVSSVLVCMLVTTRQVGVFLIAGYGTWLGCRALKGTISWKQAVYAAVLPGLVASLTLLGMILFEQHTKVLEPTHSHWDMLLHKTDFTSEHKEDTLVAQLVEGFRIRLYEIGRLVIPGMFGCYARMGHWLNVNTFIYMPVAALCFFGWYRLVRRHCDSLTLMIPFYFALYVYWPCDQGGRFFAPILPVLFLSLWKGLVLLPKLRSRWILRGAIIAHAVVALGFWLNTEVRNYPRYQSQGEEVKVLVSLLKDKPGKIGVKENLFWPVMYLQHLLDSPLNTYPFESPPEYLVWPVQQELPPGYTELTVGATFRLAQYSHDPGVKKEPPKPQNARPE